MVSGSFSCTGLNIKIIAYSILCLQHKGIQKKHAMDIEKKYLKKNIEFLSGLTFEVRNITRGLEFKEENISKINW